MGDNNQQQQGQQQQGQQQQQSQQQNQQGQQQQNQQQAERTYDQIYKAMSESDRKIVDDHLAGLNNTNKAVRDERDGLKDQLKVLLEKAEKGSDLETKLTDAINRLDKETFRANFAEMAISPEVACNNVKAAFAMASAYPDLYVKRSGEVDWAALKKDAPQLFGPITPDGHGGDGTNDTADKPVDMNAWLRSGK